ncbi:MAG: His/Gly/Thr/Pro-type tRNA ligase C-terminal domain-containing protein, partial [Bacteroidota bacterium]
DVMEELNIFPASVSSQLRLLLIAFDADCHRYAFNCLKAIRRAGIHAELYPDPVKLKKQMKYANARQVPQVVLIGSQEMESGLLTVKNMETGTQESLSLEQIIERLS